jgi:RNA polymerase sigma-70 factor (ECF subfamily)
MHNPPLDLQALFEQYGTRVYRYCLHRVDLPREAEDLTSVIFTRAFTHWQTYRGGSLEAWLFRIAHNAVVNYLRDRREAVSLDELGESADEQWAHPAPDLLEQMVRDEEYARLRRLIGALPDEDQELLALRLDAGLSAKAIGEIVGKREGAVRVAIYRLMQRLRQAWQEDDQK